MINDMQMLIATLIGGALGGLIMMLAMASVVFIFDIFERKEK